MVWKDDDLNISYPVRYVRWLFYFDLFGAEREDEALLRRSEFREEVHR